MPWPESGSQNWLYPEGGGVDRDGYPCDHDGRYPIREDSQRHNNDDSFTGCSSWYLLQQKQIDKTLSAIRSRIVAGRPIDRYGNGLQLLLERKGGTTQNQRYWVIEFYYDFHLKKCRYQFLQEILLIIEGSWQNVGKEVNAKLEHYATQYGISSYMSS